MSSSARAEAPRASVEDAAAAPAVTVIVPAFNRAKDLEATLGAIAAQSYPIARVDVLVVDTGSTDGTDAEVRRLAQILPVAIRYARKPGGGPTGARNLGLTQTTAPFLAFVDSDVGLDPRWLAATVAAMEADRTLGAVGGKVVFAHAPEVLNAFGGTLSRIGLAWDLHEGEAADTVREPEDVAWLNGSAMLVRSEAFRRIGGFDEALFYAYEEPDLCLRLRLAGYAVRVIPEALAYHRTGAEIGRSHGAITFHSWKNRLRVMLKVWSVGSLVTMLPGLLAYQLTDTVLRPGRVEKLRALGWNLRHLGDTLAARRRAQRLRRVPDRVLLSHCARGWFPPTPLAGLRRRPVAATVAERARDDRVPAAGSSA